MTAVEYLAQKFQELLGTQYEVMENHAFENHLTRAAVDPYGRPCRDINYTAFNAYKDTIIAVAQTHHGALPNVSYTFISDTYEVLFWVPVDFRKPENFALKGESGEVAPEPPLFDFEGDMARLLAELKNTSFEFTAPITQADGTTVDTALRAMFTMSEPILAGNQVEKSGSFHRVVYKVSGNILIADARLKIGRDVKISLGNGIGAFYPVKHPTDIGYGSGTEANGIQSTDQDTTKQEVAANSFQINFKVGGFDIENDPALQIIHKKATLNPAILTPLAPNLRLKKMVLVKYEFAGIGRIFWGILTASGGATGDSGIFQYEVSIADSGDVWESENGGDIGGGEGDGDDGDYEGGEEEPDPVIVEKTITFQYAWQDFDVTYYQMQVAPMDGGVPLPVGQAQKLDFAVIPVSETPLSNINVIDIKGVSIVGYWYADNGINVEPSGVTYTDTGYILLWIHLFDSKRKPIADYLETDFIRFLGSGERKSEVTVTYTIKAT